MNGTNMAILKIRQQFAIIILLFLISLGPSAIKAQPYFPSTTLSVATEIIQTENSNSILKRQYWIDVSSGEEKELHINFYSSLHKKHLVSHFTKTSDGLLTWQRTVNTPPETITADIFIRPGFPLPVDIFPVDAQETEKKEYKVETISGGRKFVNTYTVTIEEIAVETAKANGWLRVDLAKGTKLRLFSASNSNQESVSLQLWPIDRNWWLYEETGFRRSWLLP